MYFNTSENKVLRADDNFVRQWTESIKMMNAFLDSKDKQMGNFVRRNVKNQFDHKSCSPNISVGLFVHQ